MDPRAHSPTHRKDTGARNLLLALVFIAASAVAAAAAPAEGGPPAGAPPSGSLLSRASTRLNILDRSGPKTGRSRSDSLAAADLEEEARNLRPYCGCLIDTIIVVGNTHTKRVTIVREMATKQGACLEESLIRRDGAYLRGLGYFAEVSIVADRIEPARCRLVVAVGERPGLFMRVPYPVVNYDFERGISYGATWKIKNFRGLAEDLSVTAMARKDVERGASFSWNVPWLMGKRVRFRADAATYERLEAPNDAEEDFVKQTTGGSVGFGVPLSRSIVRQLWLQAGLSFEGRTSRLTLIRPGGATSRELVRQNYVSPTVEILYDSRDNRISPFNGMLHRWRARPFVSVRGPEQHYVYYSFFDSFYLPAGKRQDRAVVIALRGEIREGDLPSYSLMKLGGVRNVRGYSDEDTAPVRLLGTLEYRARIFQPRVFRIPKIGAFDVAANFIAFVDNGVLMGSILDLDKTPFHTTLGTGVEIISPFRDIMRLEVASDGTGTPAFYLTAGTDF